MSLNGNGHASVYRGKLLKLLPKPRLRRLPSAEEVIALTMAGSLVVAVVIIMGCMVAALRHK